MTGVIGMSGAAGRTVAGARARRSLFERAGAGVCLFVLLAACSSGNTAADAGSGPSSGSASSTEPDVSTSGRMAYACALVRDLPADGSVFDPDAGTVGSEFAGATRLFGATTGSHVPGYESLSEEALDVVRRTTTLDMDGVNAGITAMADDCAERGLPDHAPDISQQGRITYACALIADVRADDYPLDSSNFTVRDVADPALTAVAGAAGLLAGPGSPVGAGGTGLEATASTIHQAILKLDLGQLNSSIDALAADCAQR